MKKLKVLIACEFSGIVRDAFIAKGHDAISCDLLPTERPGPHIQGSILSPTITVPCKVLYRNWDLIIAHPPCTYLCNSGVRWLYEKDTQGDTIVNGPRWKKMGDAAWLFRAILTSLCEKIAIENPIPHSYATGLIGRKYDQIIQPWQFGHGETKATCLWLKGLPKLKPTNIVPGREARIHKLPPGPERSKIRSITYQGIADAMADQWG